MPPLAVHARFAARAGHGDDLVTAVEAMLAAAQREEGTLVYALHRDRDDADAVVMYELYADDDALDVHGRSQAAERFGATLTELLAAEPVVWFSRPVAAKGLALPDTADG